MFLYFYQLYIFDHMRGTSNTDFSLVLETCVPVRLQGPLSESGTGRVEILHNGRWGTVCDDSWDINDARVVCRQLGFQNAIDALQGSDVPDGSGQIWLDDVNCGGYESSLFSCSHRGWGEHNCGHGEDAGVKCAHPGKQPFWSMYR
jgi:deleted-in-malignant-brain-tumors protein 1